MSLPHATFLHKRRGQQSILPHAIFQVHFSFVLLIVSSSFLEFYASQQGRLENALGQKQFFL